MPFLVWSRTVNPPLSPNSARLSVAPVAKGYEVYHWTMSRICPELLDPKIPDRSLAADALVREEPEEEDEEDSDEEDSDNDKEDDDGYSE
jgi:hypothetical protein